jgi:hypothetical protein
MRPSDSEEEWGMIARAMRRVIRKRRTSLSFLPTPNGVDPPDEQSDGESDAVAPPSEAPNRSPRPLSDPPA